MAGYSTHIAGRNVHIGLSFIQMWSRTVRQSFRDSIELDYLHPPPLGGSSCWIWQAMAPRCIQKHSFHRHSETRTPIASKSSDFVSRKLHLAWCAAQRRNHPIVSRTLHFAWRCCVKLHPTRSCTDNPPPLVSPRSISASEPRGSLTTGSKKNKASLRIFTAKAALGIFGEHTLKPLGMIVMGLPTGETWQWSFWFVVVEVTQSNKSGSRSRLLVKRQNGPQGLMRLSRNKSAFSK